MFKISFEAATLAELFASAASFAALSGVNHAPIMPNNSHVGATDPDEGPANVNAPAVDNTGLPWDARIHAATKATLADGSWRKKRGVDAATVANVEMELRRAGQHVQQQTAPQTQFQPAPQQQFQPQPPVQQFQPAPQQQFNPAQQFDANGHPIQPQSTFQPAPQQQFQPQTAPQQQFQPAPQQQQQPATVDFAGLMQIISGAMQAGAINNTDIASICQNLGIANIAMLQNNPNGVQQAVALLRQWGKIQ